MARPLLTVGMGRGWEEVDCIAPLPDQQRRTLECDGFEAELQSFSICFPATPPKRKWRICDLLAKTQETTPSKILVFHEFRLLHGGKFALNDLNGRMFGWGTLN